MKKKIIIILIIVQVIIITSFILLYNTGLTTVTLDINPSIELNINKREVVKSIKPLNDDAKEIISSDLKGKKLDTVLTGLTNNIIEKGYIEENNTIEILIYSKEENISKTVENKLKDKFGENQVNPLITIIEEVTKEDTELANKYGITPAKAAYINSLIENNENIPVKEMIDKPIKELSETKQTGKYCDAGYTLEVDTCIKEIGREPAATGDVCPDGYTEYDNNCYKSVGVLESDEYECINESTLEGDKCVGTREVEPKGNFTCEVGKLIKRGEVRDRLVRDSGDWNEYLCEDTSTASYPTERCYLQEHAVINGKCAMGPKPLLPTPTGCEGDDINYNGGCYDPTPDEPYVCPNGDRFDTNTELCVDTFKYTKASGEYICNDGETLSGMICLQKTSEPARHKRYCEEGYEKTEDDKCIKRSETTSFIDGYVCNKENTRLIGNTCIIYEIIPANYD